MAAKIIRTLVFSPAKNGFKSVISFFCCSVSVWNISLHFQTDIFEIFVWQQPELHTEIWSDHHQSVWNDMKKQNKLRQTKSRRTVSTSARCFKRTNVWKCKLIFPTDTLQQKIEIIDLNHFLGGENISFLIILAVCVRACVRACASIK